MDLTIETDLIYRNVLEKECLLSSSFFILEFCFCSSRQSVAQALTQKRALFL